jgi:hypothetical protein
MMDVLHEGPSVTVANLEAHGVAVLEAQAN